MTERRHDTARPAEAAGRGTVEEFDVDVGLGVIRTDDGARVPFHCVEIADGTRTVEVGATVEFVVVTKLGRREAVAIRS